MSVELLEKEIRRLLSTTEPEAICISGRWGVGKTYAWNHFLREAQAANGIALSRYAYVSLFGTSSIDELKSKIFENTVDSKTVGIEPSVETFRDNIGSFAKLWVKRTWGFAKRIDWIKENVGGFVPSGLLYVRETIVCLDDLERLGEGLSLLDVFGLVSTLKDHKKCKVVLILNKDELGNNRAAEFEKYFEKIIDVHMEFDPTAAECAQIALTRTTPTDKLLAECVTKLGIANIRIIKKIERAVQRIEPLVAEFDGEVLRQAVQSLALLGWHVYEPDNAPSLDCLKKTQASAGCKPSIGVTR
jgi:hypothetical protein